MKAEKRNQLAEKAFREMVHEVLVKDYKILGSEDGDRFVYFKPSKVNPKTGAYITCRLFDLSVKVMYYKGSGGQWYINTDNYEPMDYKFDENQEYKQIYIVTRIFENRYKKDHSDVIPDLRHLYDSEDPGFAYLNVGGNRIRLDRDITVIQVSEDHYNKWGPQIVKTAYLPLKYSDFTSSDTINTFDDLMKEL